MGYSRAIIHLGAELSFPADPNDNPEKSSPETLFVKVTQKDDLATSLSAVPQSTLKSVDIQVMSNNLDSHLNPMAVASLTVPLENNGILSFSVVASSSEGGVLNTSIISTAFLLAGLTTQSEACDANGTKVFTAVKKVQASGSLAARRIQLRTSSNEEKKQDTPSARAPTTSRVMLANFEDDDDENLVDEEALLQDDGGGLLAPPDMSAEAVKKLDDCGGRKPCDDCTCGRADREAGTVTGAALSKQKTAPTSSCGNCAKGDAFRCASCPFLGKPAFKPGEEHLVLELSDDI